MVTVATSRLQGHENRHFLWLSVQLPQGSWKSPAVFLPRVITNLEVYLDRELVYSYGELKPSYANRFAAFVSHRFVLPEDFQGKRLFFRIFSTLPQISGIDGSVYLGSFDSVLVHIIRENTLQFFVGIFCILIGFLSFIAFCHRSVRKTLAPLHFGFFTLLIGLVFISVIAPTAYLIQAPKLFYYMMFIPFFLFPAALIAFVDTVIGPGYKLFVRRLWQLHLVIVLVAFGLEFFGRIPLPSWFSYLQILGIFELVVITGVSVYGAVKGKLEAKIFTFGVAIFSILTIYDIVRKTGYLSLMPVGTFIFIMLLGNILFHRFMENSKRLQIYAKELEDKSEMLEEAKEQLEEYSRTLEQKVEDRTKELREKQAQLVQSSKMASLGSLVAGVAHEINTPVGAVSSMHDTLMRAVDKLKIEIEQNLNEFKDKSEKISSSLNVIDDANKVIQSGTERVNDIVRRLRSFARLDEAELKEADINEGLDDTLTMIHHEIKHNINVIKNYGDIPVISCFPGRLNQVFLNILINAKQAIQGKGEIILTTSEKNNKVYVEFQDSGAGIPRESLNKIFDPGFTTKGVGVGTGLGLSICYQIIEDHHGEILVESELGKGTTITVILPMDLEKRLESR
jgi:signal transduction histidine kinase